MQLRSIRTLGLTALIVITAAFAITSTTLAQEVETADGVTLDEVNEVARELWCPLCSGVRLDACELKACVQMKEMIAIQLADGEDVDTIKAYFVDQYGPQVLGEPPREGFNWLAWILPVIAFVFGGVFLWRQMRRMMQPSAQPSMETAPQSANFATSPAGSAEAGVNTPADEYESKLEEELARYE